MTIKQTKAQRETVPSCSTTCSSKPIAPTLIFDEKKILKKYRFDNRIFTAEKDDHYHRHSFLVHPLLEKFGKKSLRINKRNPEQKDSHHSLPGMILFKDRKPPCHCFFHMCKDPKGICYHRGYDIVSKDLFSKAGQEAEYAYNDLPAIEEVVENSATNSVVLNDDHAKMVIYEAYYKSILVVFKHSFS